VNYSFKILSNPLLKIIYDYEGHHGLKIFYNNIKQFEQILPESNLNFENEIERNHFLYLTRKILKKIKKIKLQLIKINLNKYTNDSQEIKFGLNLSDYLARDLFIFHSDSISKSKESKKKSEEKERDINSNSNSNSSINININASEEFIDCITSMGKSRKNNFDIRNRNLLNSFSHYPRRHLLGFNKIGIGHLTSFKIERINAKIDYGLYSNFNLTRKTFKLNQNIEVNAPIILQKRYICNSKFVCNKKKITSKSSFDFQNFQNFKNFAFLKKPFFEINYKFISKKSKNKKSQKTDSRHLNLILGNTYLDEGCKVKSSFSLTKKEFYFYFHSYLRDSYNSIIGFDLVNLRKIQFFYKGYISNDIHIESKSKIKLKLFKNSISFFFKCVYNLSENFKIKISNFIYWNGSKDHLTNTITLNLQFKTFLLKIPIFISKVENSASVKEIILFNALINGVVYTLHWFKKLLF
jgi:hypothetical protein